jgi:hypothetical protein
MKANEVTALFLVFVILAVGAFDVAMALFVGREATVSIVVQRWSQSFPGLVLALGYVLGHLFWPLPADGGEKLLNWIPLLRWSKSTPNAIAEKKPGSDLPLASEKGN